jgi:hypothetical protein
MRFIACPYSFADLPAGGAFFAKSHARHRYQLATLLYGAHFFARFNITSGLGRSAASIARVFGTR